MDESSRPQVIVKPLDSLSDDKISIEVFKLPGNIKVTLKASIISDYGEFYESYGHYISSSDGKISVKTDECIGGTYKGVEPMGLLWSMKPATGQRQGIRLVKRDVFKPYIVGLEVLEGHKDYSNKLASTSFRRHFMGPGVRRIPVKTGGIRGFLFLPCGNGPFPGVIDLFGSAGGILEFKASLLASHGFATLALAFFNFDDLPKVVTDISLEYFEEALQWFTKHPMVRPGGIGLMGVSKGAELVLTLASYQPQLVRAVVAVSPAHAIIAVPLTIRGTPSSFVKFEPEMSSISPEGGIQWRRAYPDNITTENECHPATIAVENIQCPILLVYGEDDMNWDSERMAELIVKRLDKYNKKSLCTQLRYRGTGHLIEPPYAPHCKMSYHKAYRMYINWGGEGVKHCKAQEDSWEEIQHFFRQNLPQSSTVKSYL